LGALLLRRGEGRGGRGREWRRGKDRGREGKAHEPAHYLEEVYAYESTRFGYKKLLP